MACFGDITVLWGSVATYATYGGTFNIHLTANLPVQKFCKSVKIWQFCGHESVAPFLAHPVGPSYKERSNNVVSMSRREIISSNSIRYLDVYLTVNNVYSCSLRHARRFFYRSFNAIIGTVGRTASEEVIIELLKKKCLPILYYATEVCPLNKAYINLWILLLAVVLVKYFV